MSESLQRTKGLILVTFYRSLLYKEINAHGPDLVLTTGSKWFSRAMAALRLFLPVLINTSYSVFLIVAVFRYDYRRTGREISQATVR